MADDIIKENDEVVQPAQVDELDQLRQELGEAKDKHIRLFAEFDNVRKRHQREREELIKYAHEDVIVEILGFYEDFERTLQAAKAAPSADGQALIKGVDMVAKRMQELFKKYDVKEIEAAGKPFDHERHEAMMVVETDEHPDHTVLEVFQKGYMIGDRVARTAKVKVSKKNNNTFEQGAGSGEQG